MHKDWTQGSITITDGIEIFYTRTGKGEKPPIVLAHGITDSGLCWHQFASELEEDYDLIMYDAYGHGKSSCVDPKKRFNLSEDLRDLIEALKLTKPGVVGHSMGAATAADFAAAYPTMLSALVLEDPPWPDREPNLEEITKTMQQWKQRNFASKKKSVKELVKKQKKETPNWEEAILEEWAKAKIDMDPAVFDHYPLKHIDWREQVKTIKVPTLIVTGDADLGAVITPKMGLEAVKLLSTGEFGHISTAGHCVRYAQFRPYVTMIKVFLKRNLQS